MLPPTQTRWPACSRIFCDQGRGGRFAVGAGHGDDAAGADLEERFHFTGKLRALFAQPAQRRDIRVHTGRAEDDISLHIVKIMLSDVEHSTRPLQLQNLRVELFPRRFVAGQHVQSARKEHPDERPVAHADAEHGDFFYQSGNQNTDRQDDSYSKASFKISCLYYIRAGKKLQSI